MSSRSSTNRLGNVSETFEKFMGFVVESFIDCLFVEYAQNVIFPFCLIIIEVGLIVKFAHDLPEYDDCFIAKFGLLSNDLHCMIVGLDCYITCFTFGFWEQSNFVNDANLVRHLLAVFECGK